MNTNKTHEKQPQPFSNEGFFMPLVPLVRHRSRRHILSTAIPCTKKRSAIPPSGFALIQSVFPFLPNGISGHQCVGSEGAVGGSTRHWCSLTPNYDTDKAWGYCGQCANGTVSRAGGSGALVCALTGTAPAGSPCAFHSATRAETGRSVQRKTVRVWVPTPTSSCFVMPLTQLVRP